MRCVKTIIPSLAVLLLALVASPLSADDKAKDEATLKNASTVLQTMLSDKSIPADVLSKADCIMILPGVKKFAIGIGGSGGRGPMSCRGGSNFTGKWSAPAMYTIGGASAGLQLGGSSTDFVLLFMAPAAVDKTLGGKTKIGSDMTAAAGPSGATASSIGGADVLTYAKAKGAFAGISLSGASLEPDGDANKRLYDKTVSAREIVIQNSVPATPGGQALITELTQIKKK
jgi:lipid-binding SYLF domain-containing protein